MVRHYSQETCEALINEMKSGKIKWFNPLKGYGFITPKDPVAEDIFIHISAVESSGLGTLYEDQEVTFEVETNKGKSSAYNIVTNEILASDDTLKFDSQQTLASIELVQHCTEELISYLKANPKRLYKMHPAAFEELVATIFEVSGFTVEMHKGWNQPDGGVDIIAVRMNSLVPFRTVIQCKRYSQKNRVTAEPIRSLAGVLDRYRAHVGVLATTSYFTKPAVEEARNHIWRVNLHDYEDIVADLMRLHE